MSKNNNYATKVYLNGNIIAMDKANTITEGLAVVDNKIMEVGREESLKSLIGPETEVIDLDGKTLLPGFYDPHSHFSAAGVGDVFQVDLNSPPIGKMNTIDDYLNALKQEAEKLPAGEWILGRGYDDTLVAEKRHPTIEDLDKVSTEHPIFAAHISNHMAVVNSKAFEVAGITKDTPDPEGGVIAKDKKTGQLNGLLEETAMSLVRDLIPPLTQEDKIAGIEHASNLYASKGITTANEGGGGKLVPGADYESYLKALEEDKLKVRISYWIPYAEFDEFKDVKSDTKMITIGGVKEFQDGSIQGYTGYLSEPYHLPYLGDETYCGYPWQSREKLISKVRKVHGEGFQLYIHGNGDAAIDDILAAYELVQEENPKDDMRHVVIHAQMAREDQLDKMKELGVIPSFFSLHTYYWGDRHRDIFIGPERAFRMNPAKSAVDRDMVFTTHSDTPVVPQTPLLAMWSAVNRTSYLGNVIGEEQRISPLDALKTHTINAAYQNHEEKEKGSLEAGKFADLVILAENPLTCPPENIRDITVLETIVDGKTIFKANN